MFARLPLKTAFGAAALAAAGLLLTPAAASAQAYSYQGAPQPYGGYSSQSYGYDQSSSYGYTQRPDYRDDRAYGQSYDRSNYNCRSERRGRTGPVSPSAQPSALFLAPNWVPAVAAPRAVCSGP